MDLVSKHLVDPAREHYECERKQVGVHGFAFRAVLGVWACLMVLICYALHVTLDMLALITRFTAFQALNNVLCGVTRSK